MPEINPVGWQAIALRSIVDTALRHADAALTHVKQQKAAPGYENQVQLDGVPYHLSYTSVGNERHLRLNLQQTFWAWSCPADPEGKGNHPLNVLCAKILPDGRMSDLRLQFGAHKDAVHVDIAIDAPLFSRSSADPEWQAYAEKILNTTGVNFTGVDLPGTDPKNQASRKRPGGQRCRL